MLDFDNLPKPEKEYMIRAFGLRGNEEEILLLRYVYGFSYRRIADEMNLSERSVGNSLTRARRRMVDIAKDCYPLADERLRSLIDVVGWRELEWPTLGNRHKKARLRRAFILDVIAYKLL